jgi:heme A synthase
MMNDFIARTRVRRLAGAALWFTIALTVGIGGTITSAEVGMAYPTWPDINGGSLFSFFYGELAAQFGLGSVVEHTHRQAGALTGLLVIAAAAAAWCGRGVPRAVRWLALAALLATIAQGLLGALRVLANSYSGAIVHAIGAQAVVVLIVALRQRADPRWDEPPARVPADALARLRLWSLLGFALLFVNLFAAASLRHKQGAFVGHLALALATSAALLTAAHLAARACAASRAARRYARQLLVLIAVQILLGVCAWTWLLGPLAASDGSRAHFLLQSSLATAHLLVGVLVMAAGAALAIEARWRIAPEVAR